MAVPKKIEQNMEVVGRDGAHVGIVERIEGTGEIKLAKDDPDAAGQLAAASDVGRARDQGGAVAMVDPNGPAGFGRN